MSKPLRRPPIALPRRAVRWSRGVVRRAEPGAVDPAPGTSALVLEAWRAVARNRELPLAMETIAAHLAAVAPVRGIEVVALHLDQGWRAVLARSGAPDAPVGGAPVGVRPGDVALFERWLEPARACAWRPDGGGRLRALVDPARPDRSLVALPLPVGATRSAVVLVEVVGDPEPVLPLVQALADPLGVAVEQVGRPDDRGRRGARSPLPEAGDVVVGAEGGLRAVMRRVEQVAETDIAVLILGESGTGKEVLARAVHTRSRRAAGPFIRVNCGAIPPGLVDSELFGHERGSFTGAIAARVGWFERAHGGTLFLDEIGELPPAAQVRLLRVLQDGVYERVGGGEERVADVRLVAATHRDLQALVQSGAFRADLWYRVSAFPLLLPPLRERREDLPALAAHFAVRAGVRLFGTPLGPTPDDLRLLEAHDWPGNVRELASVIERAAILGGGRRLEIRAALRTSTGGVGVVDPALVGGSLEAANRRAILDALARTRGRIEGKAGAAALLGINPHTLRSRMRKLGIDWSEFRPS